MWDHGGQGQGLIMHLVLGGRRAGTAVGIIPHGIGFRLPHRIQCNVGIGRIGAARLVLRRRSRSAGRPAEEVVSCAGRSRRAQSQGYILGLGLRRGCPAAAIGIVGNGVGGRLIRNGHIPGFRNCNRHIFKVRRIESNIMILYFTVSNSIMIPVTV